MEKLLNWKYGLLFIIILAAFLRFYKLDVNPPSLTWDEVAWGYNAYSLSVDGRDEFGRFLPFNYLESFGDFKPPVYAYLDILPVKFFGLNEFATRFPSAFFGVLTVLVSFFLVKRIFKNSQFSNLYALFSSLFLAISPWHINLSRAAFEANIATFFLVTGVWLFLYSIQQKRIYLILSAIFFVLSLYTFNSARVVAPLLVAGLTIGFRKDLLKNKKEVLLALIIGILTLAPIFKFLLSPQANLRFREVNIFSDISIVEKTNQEILNDNNASWSKILHNRRFAYGIEYLRHYFDNLNPHFLFIKGDGNPKFSTQDMGQMYIWDIIFFITGVLFVFRKKEGLWWVVPLWLILAIIPAASARETPHALRIEATLPTFQILTAYGFVTLIMILKNKIKSMTIYGFILIIIFLTLSLNMLYYLHSYYFHYQKEFSGEWQYGYKESIDYVEKVKGNYNSINITSSLGRPYIYYLFYTKTDPRFFRKNAYITRDVFGFVTVQKYDKYKFTKGTDNLEITKNTLYIETNVPNNAKLLKTFYLLNGKPVLYAYTF